MKLKLKFVISASPFYYGLIMVSYNPKPDSHAGPTVVIAGDQQLVTYSQRPHVLMNVSTSQGAEMELPYFNDKNWIENSTTDIATMGQLDYDSFGLLSNANSVAGTTVNLRTYCWAEDVVLSGPTIRAQSSKRRKSKVKMQSISEKLEAFGTKKDEYGTGPVSGVASAVATAGGALKSVPIIGPFARATEIGAGALSRVAAWFGYTNVPVITNSQPMYLAPFRGHATTEISAPIEKLVYDPKQELSIDSRTVGLDGKDELAFSSFVRRESFLTTFSWVHTAASNDSIFVSYITPNLFRRYAPAADVTVYPTPMHHLAEWFTNWTGDIIFRFVIVATQYHRGRLKVSWDPFGDIDNNPDNETANITKIIDISECKDFEIRVPYMQAMAWLKTRSARGDNNEHFGVTTPSGGYQSSSYNGYLVIRVANELTAPDAAPSIPIVVFVRGADNLRFNGPAHPNNAMYWSAQSEVQTTSKGEFAPDNSADSMIMGEGEDEGDLLLMSTFGEEVKSLRAMFHRITQCLDIANLRAVGATDVYQRMTPRMSMLPPPPGLQSFTNGIHVDSAANPCNFTQHTPMGWFTPCYAGWRGSVNWTIATTCHDAGKIIAYRAPQTVCAAGSYISTGSINNASLDQSQYAYSSQEQNQSNAGGIYSERTSQSCLAVQIPFFSPYRFHPTHPKYILSGVGNTSDQHLYQNWTFEAWTNVRDHVTNETGDLTLALACGAGPDYTCFFFTGVPSMIVNKSIVP
jgi:hypothetical protein